MSRHGCPDCACPGSDDRRTDQPATSNDAHRRAVIRGALAVLDSKKRARTTAGSAGTAGDSYKTEEKP